MSGTRWLKVSFRVGALVDGLAAVMMLVPDLGRVVYGMADYEPTTDYQYAMRLAASLMLGWTVLLLWADRKPLERRGILPITVLVIGGLAWAGAYAVSAGFISLPYMIPTWILQILLGVLFLYSYFASGRAMAEQSVPAGALSLAEAAARFLAQDRFAVAGVSRGGQAPANLILKKLKDSGRRAYAINPNAEAIDGERCYGSLADLPEPPDAVMIATHPDQAMEIARQCQTAGVRHVWFHRSIDGGSYSPEAAALCEAYGAMLISGGCPMMHLEPVDIAHRCMRVVLSCSGRLPKAVAAKRD